jgi:hypothetical protein
VVKTRSLQTTQNEILAAMEKATDTKWEVKRESTRDTAQRGREYFQAGRHGEAYASFFASQIWEDGFGRGIPVTEEESDNTLLGVETETLEDIVKRVLDEQP